MRNYITHTIYNNLQLLILHYYIFHKIKINASTPRLNARINIETNTPVVCRYLMVRLISGHLWKWTAIRVWLSYLSFHSENLKKKCIFYIIV